MHTLATYFKPGTTCCGQHLQFPVQLCTLVQLFKFGYVPSIVMIPCRAKVLGWKFKSAQEFFKTSDNASSSVEAAERVQPLFTGKVSTAVQFGLIATCTVTGALGFAHGNQYVQFWVINTFLWTALSGLQYLYICNWLSDSFKLRAVGATTLALAAYQYRRGGLECFQM